MTELYITLSVMYNWTNIHDCLICLIAPCSNGACENKRGSFFCNCRTAKSRSGKFCQLKNDVCKSSPCSGKEKCYPKDVVEGYECLNATKTVTMTYRLGETRTPFEEWMTHDIAKEIENAINDATIIQTKDGKWCGFVFLEVSRSKTG